MQKLYIPKTIKVGFQERNDTYTSKLGYVIYYDGKGVLRKETSWNSWRDNKIEPIESPNEPARFLINKRIKRYADWFGSDKEKVRIYDHRDFEFEISIANLIEILQHSDITKRDIMQECVYAWQGTELVLLPTNSEEYKESLANTEKLDSKFSAKDLVIGRTYTQKREEGQYIYLGRFKTYSYEKKVYVNGAELDEKTIKEEARSWQVTNRKEGDLEVITMAEVEKKPSHIFMLIGDKNQWYSLEPSSKIGGEISNEIHPDYAEYHDAFFSLPGSKKIVDLKVCSSNTEDSKFAYDSVRHVQIDDKIIQLHFSSYGSSTFSVYELIGKNAFEMVKAKNTIKRNPNRYWSNEFTREPLPIDPDIETKAKEIIANFDVRFKASAVDVVDYMIKQRKMIATLDNIGIGKIHAVFEDGTVSKTPFETR